MDFATIVGGSLLLVKVENCTTGKRLTFSGPGAGSGNSMVLCLDNRSLTGLSIPESGDVREWFRFFLMRDF